MGEGKEDVRIKRMTSVPWALNWRHQNIDNFLLMGEFYLPRSVTLYGAPHLQGVINYRNRTKSNHQFVVVRCRFAVRLLRNT